MGDYSVGRFLPRANNEGFFESCCDTVDRTSHVEGTKGPFWRKDDPVIEDGKVTLGGMFSHQREWWELPNFIKVLVAGLGSGKTLIGCKRIVSLALENSPVPVATVSPSFAVARRTVIPTIQDLLQGKQSHYGQSFWWRYNSATHEFKIKFKHRNSSIHCLSGERPLSLRGPNLGSALLDEPFIMEFEVFKQMIARIRHPDAPIKELLLTGSPEGSLSWGYDLIMGDMRNQNDVGFVQASTRQNLALDKEYVPRLEAILSERAAQAYIEGKFVNLSEGQVYYAFDPVEHVVDLKMPETAELGVGMDFNVNPMAATVFWRNGPQMHFIKEYELPNADTEYMCQKLKEDFPTLREVFPDASGRFRATSAPGGKSDYYYIKQAGFVIRAKDANPPRKDRYNSVNGKFRPRNGQVTLTISPSCKQLIKYLNIYSHELMHKQEAESHILDSMSYPIFYLFPVNREELRVEALRGL